MNLIRLIPAKGQDKNDQLSFPPAIAARPRRVRMKPPLTKRDEIRAASEAMRPPTVEVSLSTSIIIARLLGPLFATIGVGMVINTDTYRQIGQQFLTTYAIIYLSGIIILLMGLTILNFHSRWTPDWRSTITAVGFVLTIAGVWRLIALGGFLTFQGYVATHETQPKRARVQGDLR